MKKTLLITLLLLFSVSPSKSQEIKIGSQQSIEPLPSKSIVRGRVIYEDSGRPVRRGLIGLLGKEPFKDTGNFTISDIVVSEFVLTNNEGEFEIKNVIAGEYYPFVDVPNVLNLQSVNKFYGKNSTLALSKSENFFQKITVDGYSEINVLIIVKRGAAVSGRIIYSDGSPAVNFKVKIIRKKVDEWDDDLTTVREMFTDDRGFYRFTELLPGAYYIKVTEPSDHRGDGKVSRDDSFFSSSELTIFYPDVSTIEKAKSIETNWGQEQTDIDLIIPDRKLFKISGSVIGKDNKQPIANASISFEKIDETEDESYYFDSSNTIYSDEKGNWSFKDLPQGTYRIEVRSPQNKTEKYAKSYKEIKIENENLQDIQIELPMGASVSGIVKFENGKNLPYSIYIYLNDEKNKIRAGTSIYHQINEENNSKKEREFRVGSLPKGSYIFRCYVRDGFYVKSAKLNGTDLMTETLEIGEAESIEDIQITLADDVGTLTGKIFETQNVPAKLAGIMLVPTDSRNQKGSNLYFWAITKVNGEFQIKAAPGEYFITFPKKYEDNKLSEEEKLKMWTKDAENINIKTDETKNILLFLPKQ